MCCTSICNIVCQIWYIIFTKWCQYGILNTVEKVCAGGFKMKRLNRKRFRKEVVSDAALAEINYDRAVRMCDFKVFAETSETLLGHPGRIAYARIVARCYGNQTDVFVNNRYLTTFFRK